MFRLRQRTRHMLYAALTGAGIVMFVFIVYLVISQNHNKQSMNLIEQKYEGEINRLKEGKANQMTSGWITVREIGAGEKLRTTDLEQKDFPADRVPSDALLQKDDIEGKITKIALKSKTLVTGSVLYEAEAASNDLRNREISFVKIPAVLKSKDVIDVRIQFPTGQDYIILSKKKVKDLKTTTMTLTLTESEILSLSSAVVDAYLHKASIYALTYVEPELQMSAIPTYPANDEVLKLISKDPNILRRAEQGLSHTSRALLEKDLSALTPQSATEFEGKQVEYLQSAQQTDQNTQVK
ncbi:SAF domain-containing protein [Paenibacillus sp. YPG26]|uniref:SAF domain-containing protein n=1 Tax=Paenibacillus sp. YPG26 TaxID=2878915 RepID=UPI002042094F|nr:SAF domain-containing protein [Paenibacillus sp. YPG26]USB34903.1 SAF domain-containing protein [Paenibacillus sp. YPG26]